MLFFVGVREYTLDLRFIIKMRIDEFFTLIMFDNHIMNFASNDLVMDGWFFFILRTCVSNVFKTYNIFTQNLETFIFHTISITKLLNAKFVMYKYKKN
jgi:hypothetical protein